jgi:hypothetical protein
MLGADDPRIVTTNAAVAATLEAMGKKSQVFGGSGCGMGAKLINQALVCVHAQVAAEAIIMAQVLGLDSEPSFTALRSMLQDAWGQSTVLDLALADVCAAMPRSTHEMNTENGNGNAGEGATKHSVRAHHPQDERNVNGHSSALRASLHALALSKSAAPLRNLHKDIDIVCSEMGGDADADDASSLPRKLPTILAAQSAIREACSPGGGLKDAPFVALAQLILKRSKD